MAGSKSNAHNIAFNATAFQDHLSKSLGLNPTKSLSNHGKNISKSKNISPFKKQQVVKNISYSDCNDRPLFEMHRHQQKEFVIKTKVNSDLSLAEKHGLIKTSNMGKLSEEGWLIVKRKSKIRNDSAQPCPICKDFYKPTMQQVLLSCSHSFHRQCISSFEKFSAKIECPLCRKACYEKRVIYDGERITTNKAAVKIQSLWRCHRERIKYLKFRKSNAPKNPLLRKKYFERKFFHISKEFESNCRVHEDNVSKLLEDIDLNLASSKSLTTQLDNHLKSEKNWDKIQEQAVERQAIECPICLNSLNSTKKEVLLLSCSHACFSFSLLKSI